MTCAGYGPGLYCSENVRQPLFLCKVWLAVVFMKVITFVHWLFCFTQVIRQSQKLVIIFFVKRSSCPVPPARQLSLVTAPVIRKFVTLLYIVLHSTVDRGFCFQNFQLVFRDAHFEKVLLMTILTIFHNRAETTCCHVSYGMTKLKSPHMLLACQQWHRRGFGQQGGIQPGRI